MFTICNKKIKAIFSLLILNAFFFSISYGQNTTITVDLLGITNSLQEAQLSEVLSVENSIVVQLPYDGQVEKNFYVVQNNVIGEDLQLDYPNIKSYSVQMVDDPGVVGAITISPYGFFANYLVDGNLIGIRPVNFTNTNIHEVEIGNDTPFHSCGVTTDDQSINLPKIGGNNFDPNVYKSGTTSYTNAAGEVLKRKYDLVVAATGEFTIANGGTMTSAMTEITQTVNCVNSIFNKDMAICLVIVETCIFTDPGADPFTPDMAGGDPRATQAADQIDICATVPYDIGHVFHNTDSAINGGVTDWSGGGVAGLGVVCQDGVCNFSSGATTGPCKGAGWSGSFNNTTNGWCQLAAHEFGHMFGAEHTFNGEGGSCMTNIAGGNSYEIASGTTIMSYNGICGGIQNIPGNGVGDNYFHAASILQMTNYANGQACQTDCPTGNFPPEVEADPCGAGTTDIPIGTPFKLLGSATDADGDALTYTWEQFDEDGAGTPTQGATLTQVSTINGLTAGFDPLAPLFQSHPPSSDPCRYFPDLIDYKNGANTIGTEYEVLPQVPRTLTFALTVRDCSVNGGGTSCDVQTLNVIDGGPLVIDSPCAGGDLTAGDNINITWNTNGSDAACSNVEVLMSTDGGCNFPYNLGSGTYASGSAGITIPAGAPNSNDVRFQVVCADNPCATFFAMTPDNCTIISSCMAVQTEIITDDAICLPLGDPGLNLGLTNNFGSPVTNFNGSIETSDPGASLIFTDCPSPQCAVSGNATNYDAYDFTPDVTGSYTFTHTGSFGLVLNLYELPYTAGSCGNHVASSGVRDDGVCPGTGNIPLVFSVTATLTAGVTYSLVVSSFSATFPTPLPDAYTINFTTPGGANIYDGLINPTGYNYTYVAVDQITGNVIAIDPNSDFTALPAGCFDIYGVHYNDTAPDDVDPTTFIGQTLGAILTTGDCVSFSSNFKEVCVKGNCAISNVVLDGTPSCVGADAQYTICFDVNDGSSNYNLIDVDNGNAVISTVAGVAATGVNICFTNVTVLNHSTASIINVNVVDQLTATCIGANPVMVNLPACSNCPSVTPIDDIVNECAALSSATVSGWKAGLGADFSDPSGLNGPNAGLLYSSVPITAANFPQAETNGSYDGDNCAAEPEEFYAYYECDTDNDGTVDEYINAGSLLLTIYAAPQEPTIVKNDNVCNYSVQFVCANDSEGLTSVDGSTEVDGYAGNPSESVEVVTTDGCTQMFMIDKPACSQLGCTNPVACNYDMNATIDDGSCDLGDTTCPQPCNVILGCIDATACNFDAGATCQEPSSCDYGIVGCPTPCNAVPGRTDVTACNFDAAATCDDSTCVPFPDATFTCPNPATVALCEGLVDLLPVTAGGTWSGNAAVFVSNDQLEPIGMSLNIDYILTYTTVDASGCEDAFECVFKVVNNCEANGGRF